MNLTVSKSLKVINKYHENSKIYLLKIQYSFNRSGRIFTSTLKVFIEICYNFLTFERIVKMYNYCKEILKRGLPAPGLEPSIDWLPARRFSPLSQLHFELKKWEININSVP